MVHAALHNAEKLLPLPAKVIAPRHFIVMRAKMIERAPRPRHREPQALLCARTIRRIFGALVEGHADIRAQRDLHIHRVFRSEEVAAPIQMRPEAHTFVRNLAQLGEAIYLKSARIGKHGARPADEAMQAAHAPDRLVSGPKVKMIGVAENDLRAKRLNRVLRHGLHAAGRAHRHEHRRLHGLMRQMQLPAPAAVFRRVEQVECEAHFVILAGEHFAKLL